MAAEGLVQAYIHAGSRLGVLVEVNCETDFVARGEKFQTLANDMAMQVAACPEVEYVSMADVSPEALAKETEIEMGKEDKSKPENIRANIVKGRVEKLFKQRCLLEQPYIRDQDKTVEEVIKGAIAEIGENIQVSCVPGVGAPRPLRLWRSALLPASALRNPPAHPSCTRPRTSQWAHCLRRSTTLPHLSHLPCRTRVTSSLTASCS